MLRIGDVSQNPVNSVAAKILPLGLLSTPIMPTISGLLKKTVVWKRIFAIFFVSLMLGSIATFRSFGFDMDGTQDAYPFVADGWGLWYWFAQVGLNFYSFFLIINLIFAIQILRFSYPLSNHRSTPVRAVAVLSFLYLLFWFLFGQARYGMALVLLAPAAAFSNWPIFLFCGITASFIHKAAGGGLLLLALWRYLRRHRHGVFIASAISAGLSYGVHALSTTLLVLVGYGDYLNWDTMPAANTPVKYYYIIGILLFWKLFRKQGSDSLLILALIFLPFSYFNVFAGRSFHMFSIVLLCLLLKPEVPQFLRYLLLIPYFVDLVILLLFSGKYI